MIGHRLFPLVEGTSAFSIQTPAVWVPEGSVKLANTAALYNVMNRLLSCSDVTLRPCRGREKEGWAENVNECVGLSISVCKKENIDYIPLAHCRLDSLDIFNLILMVLRPYLTGVLFDLILKFKAALSLSLYHFLLSLMAPFLSSFHSLYHHCSLREFLH